MPRQMPKALVATVGDLEALVGRLPLLATSNTAIIQSSPFVRRMPILSYSRLPDASSP
jgi:hypothetical protein